MGHPWYTHELTRAGPLLTKRYVSWRRGEHRREWSALHQIHRHAPGLAPRPVNADLTAEPPAVTMTLVPGTELAGSLTAHQIDALAVAVTALWAVPVPEDWGWADDLHFARRLTDGPRPDGGVTARAYDAASAWWAGPDPELLSTAPERPVLGHRDPNLANYLWDGRRVRIVDFEDSAPSDPATELALLVEHLSTRDVDGLRDHFDVDERRLRAARRLWAMFWLWLVSPGGPSAGRNPPGTADRQAQRLLDLLHDQDGL